MDQYLPLLVMLVLAALFAVLSLVASALLGQRRRPTVAKLAPYECGIVPDREPAERFPVRFYLVAMIFIIFDIEIIFLFPWAVIYRQLGGFGLWEMGAFAATVFVSFVYLIGRGALDWGPLKATVPVADQARGMAAAVTRSTASTVRLVGDAAIRRGPERPDRAGDRGPERPDRAGDTAGHTR